MKSLKRIFIPLIIILFLNVEFIQAQYVDHIDKINYIEDPLMLDLNTLDIDIEEFEPVKIEKKKRFKKRRRVLRKKNIRRAFKETFVVSKKKEIKAFPEEDDISLEDLERIAAARNASRLRKKYNISEGKCTKKTIKPCGEN